MPEQMPEQPAFPLTAEQTVALVAEAVSVILEEGFGRAPMKASHLGSPHWRLARAIGIKPEYLRRLDADADASARRAG